MPIASPAFPPGDMPAEDEETATAVAVDEGVVGERDLLLVRECGMYEERRVDDEAATAIEVGRVEDLSEGGGGGVGDDGVVDDDDDNDKSTTTAALLGGDESEVVATCQLLGGGA